MTIRVLRVITRLNIGGPSRQALILQRHLPRRGFECFLAAGRSEDAEGDMTEWEAADVICVEKLHRDASPAEAGPVIRTLRRLIRRVRPHIVHTHMAMAGFAGRLAACMPGPRPIIVHTFHGHVLEGYFSPTRERLYTAVERALARRTAALIAVSPTVRRRLLQLGIGTEDRWHVVPVGLELDPLLALQQEPRPIRAVGVVGRLVEIKDHRTLFAALARLPAHVRLVVAGDGELRGSLEAHALQMGISERVEFRGWVRNLESLYAELDAVVLCSRNEGTPVALIEAMAAGCPVVATAVGGVPDVVENGVNGLLVPPGDPAAVASALLSLMEDETRANELAMMGRASVAERFSAHRLVDDIAALYARLAGETGRSRRGPGSRPPYRRRANARTGAG